MSARYTPCFYVGQELFVGHENSRCGLWRERHNPLGPRALRGMLRDVCAGGTRTQRLRVSMHTSRRDGRGGPPIGRTALLCGRAPSSPPRAIAKAIVRVSAKSRLPPRFILAMPESTRRVHAEATRPVPALSSHRPGPVSRRPIDLLLRRLRDEEPPIESFRERIAEPPNWIGGYRRKSSVCLLNRPFGCCVLPPHKCSLAWEGLARTGT